MNLFYKESKSKKKIKNYFISFIYSEGGGVGGTRVSVFFFFTKNRFLIFFIGVRGRMG